MILLKKIYFLPYKTEKDPIVWPYAKVFIFAIDDIGITGKAE